jgi:hypothetical protein
MAHDVAMASDPADAGINHDRFCNMADINKWKISKLKIGRQAATQEYSTVVSDPRTRVPAIHGPWRVELGIYRSCLLYSDHSNRLGAPHEAKSQLLADSSFKSLNLACECVCMKILRFPRVDPSLVNVQQF